MHLKNKVIVALLYTFNLGCQSAGVYKIQTYRIKDLDFQVIQVSSNRIQQKCLFLNAEEGNEWRHQYLMFILSNKNEVLEIAAPHNTDKESCREKIAAIEKMLQFKSEIRMCARDGLKQKNAREGSWEEVADFGSLGAHKVKYESLTFDSICHSRKCYGDNSAYTYTCPGFVKQ